MENVQKYDGRHAQRHHGQHHREQGCAVFWPTCDRQKPADTSKMAVNIRGRCHALRWRSRSKAAKSWKDAASIWTETEIG